MTLTQLEYFRKAAELQHFNRAAEELNISQPSLSRSIAALEDELGVVLFEKQGRNVVLTKAGEAFWVHADEILGDVRRAQKGMEELASGGGEVNLAYVSPLATRFIPLMARAFLKKEEKKDHDIIFHFHVGITSQNIEGLKRGDYDVIFGSYAPNEPDIEFVPILEQEMVVIMPEDSPLANEEYIDPAVFQDYPFIGYERNSGLGKVTRTYLRQKNLVPEISYEFPDEHGIVSLVAAGFGIALVANVDNLEKQGVVVRPLIPEEQFSHTVYMAYMKNHYRLPAVSRLIRFVQRHASEFASAVDNA